MILELLPADTPFVFTKDPSRGIFVTTGYPPYYDELLRLRVCHVIDTAKRTCHAVDAMSPVTPWVGLDGPRSADLAPYDTRELMTLLAKDDA
jgi:hypothetical protein